MDESSQPCTYAASGITRQFVRRGAVMFSHFGGDDMVKIYNDGKRITAALSGDIDHHAAREIRTELDDVISRSRPELLILDFENVGFMDSSGIGLILGRSRSVRAVGGELLIKNVRREIAEVIKISGLGHLLVVHSC